MENKTNTKSINTNNDSNEIELIFWKIWRNRFFNKQLFKQIRLYNNHLYTRDITLSSNDLLDTSSGGDIEELKNYKYSSYINRIWVGLDDDIPSKLISTRSIFNSFHKLPTNIKEIELYISLNRRKGEDIIQINNPIIPQSITKLSISSNLKTMFGVGAIPSSIKSLEFDYNIHPDIIVPINRDNQISMGSIFPKIGLTCLDLALVKNQTITKSTLPITLTKLVIGTMINSKIKCGSLPNSITYLSIASKIKLKPDLLPNTLTYLHFKVDSIKFGDLPSGLKHLKFNSYCMFNQTVSPTLFPMGLETIEFGHAFNKSLANLPKSITSLKLGGCFTMISTFNHLTSLIKLTLKNDSLCFKPYWYLLKTTPSSNYKNKQIGGYFDIISMFYHLASLFKLTFSNVLQWFQTYLTNKNDTQICDQPGLLSLEILNINPNCKFINNNSIPPKVWKLKYCSNKSIKDNSSLKHISITPDGGDDNTPSLKPMELPIGIQIIKDFSNDVPISNNLLSHLYHLHTIHFNLNFNHVILPGTLPKTLTELEFPTSYDQPFQKDSLPSNLKYLSIKGSRESFKTSHFPTSIEILVLFHLEDTPVSGITFPNLVSLIIWRDTTFENLPINSTLKSIFISIYNTPILKQKDLQLFDEYSSFIKVLNDNGLSKAFKNKW